MGRMSPVESPAYLCITPPLGVPTRPLTPLAPPPTADCTMRMTTVFVASARASPIVISPAVFGTSTTLARHLAGRHWQMECPLAQSPPDIPRKKAEQGFWVTRSKDGGDRQRWQRLRCRRL